MTSLTESQFIKEVKKNNGLFLLALPSVIFLVIFNYIPLYGLVLPFKNMNYSLGFLKSPWAGVENFRFLFESKDLFYATRNTILYNLLFIIVGNVVSIAIAIMLFEIGKKYAKIYQTMMFIPYFVSWIVVEYIVLALLDSDNGMLNRILQSFGLEQVMWYGNTKYWPVIILLAALWKGTGYSSLIYYAGLMSIDSGYYEASQIDGASKMQQIRHVTIPMLTPLASMLVILAIGRIFYADFGLFYNVTKDSKLIYPVTDVIDTYVFRSLKTMGDIGMASAAGFYQSVLGFILVVLSNYTVRKINDENSLF